LKIQQETIRDLFTLTDASGWVSLAADNSDIPADGTTVLRATVSSDAVRPLQYRWESSRGAVVANSETAEFYAGGYALGPVTVTAIVTDANGKMSSGSAVINVQPPGQASVDVLTLGTERASGIVRNVNLDDYRIVIYIGTDQLYLQPFRDMNSVWVQADGHWWTRVQNSYGGELVAWLAPRSWNPPETMPLGSEPPGSIACARTDAINDSDNDTLPDTWEASPALGRYDDPDRDGAYNVEEYWAGTNPAVSDNDSDGDQLLDNWERTFFGRLAYDGGDDPDGDGLTNLQELGLGIPPVRAAVDADRDRLHDRWELRQLETLDRSGDDPMGAGRDLLDAYELQSVNAKVWDQGGQLVMANLNAVPGAKSVVISRDGQPVATADQLVFSYDVDPSANYDFRQALVMDTNGVARLRHLDGDAPAGSEDKFGTSIKLPPGLVLEGDGSDDFFLGAQVNEIDLDTSDAAAGVLRLRMNGSPVNGEGAPAPVDVHWVLTLLPPRDNAAVAQLQVQADFLQDVTFSSVRMQEAQAFQSAMFSSHNTVSSGAQTHDADRFRLTSSAGGTLVDLNLDAAPYGQLLLGPDGVPFDGAIHLDQVNSAGPNGDPPNISLQIPSAPGGPECRGQGYITYSQDVNDDNLGAWVSRSLVGPTVRAGTTFDWTVWAAASEAPLDRLPMDTTGPRVTGMTPMAGSTVVAPSSIVVTFDEGLAASSVNATTFKVSRDRGTDGQWGTDDDTWVAGTVTCDSEATEATFTPSVALAPGEYAVWLDGTASITDLV
ncbi:MAG: hypothetical protein FJ276_33435, partial [Planctomycetes bacterium]|nr:hypothetical protein [Planctomycetota bacterium]